LTKASNGAFIKNCGEPLILLHRGRTTAKLARENFYASYLLHATWVPELAATQLLKRPFLLLPGVYR